jgi:hypothetical protein
VERTRCTSPGEVALLTRAIVAVEARGEFSCRQPDSASTCRLPAARRRAAIATFVGNMFLISAESCAGRAPRAPPVENPYFGHIQPACWHDECDAVKLDLLELDTCIQPDAPCQPAENLLIQIFGATYRPELPDFIVYFEQSERAGLLRGHQPVLLWKHKNTPHLFGAPFVYVIVLTEHPLCLSGHVTTVYKNEPNPLPALFAAFGSTIPQAAQKASETKAGEFVWYPLSGDRCHAAMWFAMARFVVDVNTTERITVEYSQALPNEPSTGAEKPSADRPQTDKPSAVTTRWADAGNSRCESVPQCVGAEGDPKKGEPAKTSGGATAHVGAPQATGVHEGELKSYSGDFLAVNGFFSNSPDAYATISIALGASFDVRHTAVESGGSKLGLNGYALVKFYARRPRVRVGPNSDGMRFSLGAFFGTGVKSPFDELVFGLSLGHLLGNVGLVGGGNYIAAPKDAKAGRKLCGFAGIDYTF